LKIIKNLGSVLVGAWHAASNKITSSATNIYYCSAIIHSLIIS